MTLSLGTYYPADPLLTDYEAQQACARQGGVWMAPDDGQVFGGCNVGDPLPTPLPPIQAGCGINPCSAWDQIWVRDGCLSYLRCADPTNPLVVGMDGGFFAGTGAAVGSAAGSTASGVLSGLFQNRDGTVNWISLALIGIGAMVLLKGR